MYKRWYWYDSQNRRTYEQPYTNGITVNYGGGGGDTASQIQQQQSVQFQTDSFPGSSSDTSNDFVCAKCTFRTDKIDQLETKIMTLKDNN